MVVPEEELCEILQPSVLEFSATVLDEFDHAMRERKELQHLCAFTPASLLESFDLEVFIDLL